MGRRLRLLLIEHSEDDAALVVGALTCAGYTVAAERVGTSAALRAALNERAWDLAIADYMAAGFKGTAALQMIRRRGVDMPFIFVSGTAGEEAAVAAMKAGAHDYILKGNMKRLAPSVGRELREVALRRGRRRAEQRLAHLAYYDALTDLPNRALLHDRLDQAARTANRASHSLALLLMDLDGFKLINDTLGHPAGDRVLQHVASRIRRTLREADTVARLGGDEFAIVLPFTGSDGGVLAAQKVLHEIDQPLVVDDRPLTVGASIGVACLPEHGTSAETLLQKADVAIYLAKTDHSRIGVYAPDRDRHTHERVTLVPELRHALAAREFFLEYQPITHLRNGAVVGVEALVRWDHPTFGRLMPGSFIDLAEQTGLSGALTMIVLDTAIAEWSGVETPPQLTVSVNLSRWDLQDPELPGRIAELLRAHGTDPSRLALEMTENMLLSDPARSMDNLARLHGMGVRLIIDDFGTGYSSLKYLRRLPVDEIKIDGSFVAEIGGGNDDVIVRSTIELAHNLGLSVVGEGVETAAACERLVELGCDGAQGIFICIPARADAAREWMARQGAPGAL